MVISWPGRMSRKAVTVLERVVALKPVSALEMVVSASVRRMPPSWGRWGGQRPWMGGDDLGLHAWLILYGRLEVE